MKKHIYEIALILVIIFHILNILVWFNRNVWPVGRDWSFHLNGTFLMMKNLNNEFSLQNLLYIDYAHPPFYYWVAMILYKICFNSYKCMFLTSALFFVLLLFSIYGIGKQLKNKEIALLSVILCSFNPLLYRNSVIFNQDLAAVAMTSLIIYTLLASDSFNKRNFSIFAGISFGLGFLTKDFIILFVAGPLLLCIYTTLKTVDKNSNILSQGRIKNLLIFITIAFFIMFIYYHKVIFFKYLAKRVNELGAVKSSNIFSWEHLGFYMKTLPYQIGILETIIILLNIRQVFKIKQYENLFLFSWYIIPLLILSLAPAKWTVYAMSYIPALILIIAITLCNLKWQNLKNGLIISLVIFNMCKYFKKF